MKQYKCDSDSDDENHVGTIKSTSVFVDAKQSINPSLCSTITNIAGTNVDADQNSNNHANSLNGPSGPNGISCLDGLDNHSNNCLGDNNDKDEIIFTPLSAEIVSKDIKAGPIINNSSDNGSVVSAGPVGSVGSRGSTTSNVTNSYELDEPIAPSRPANDESLQHYGPVVFNQDGTLFAVSTGTGFTVFEADPFRKIWTHNFTSPIDISLSPTTPMSETSPLTARVVNDYTLSHIEMLHRSNLFAFCFQDYPKQVVIWNDVLKKAAATLAFKTKVTGIRLNYKHIVVAFEHSVLVYTHQLNQKIVLVDQIGTLYNPNGLVALTLAEPKLTALSASSANIGNTSNSNSNIENGVNNGKSVLASLGSKVGCVRVELYDEKKTTMIAAHDTAIVCLALNQDGTRLATSSETGTLIRIFDTGSGKMLRELRRGTNPARICSLAFHSSSKWIVVASDKGTVHVFSLSNTVSTSTASTAAKPSMFMSLSKMASPLVRPLLFVAKLSPTIQKTQSAQKSRALERHAAANKAIATTSAATTAAATRLQTQPSPQAHNAKSKFSMFQSFLPKYFSSEWSCAQFPVPYKSTLVAFGRPCKEDEANNNKKTANSANDKNSTISIIVLSKSGGDYHKIIFDPNNHHQSEHTTEMVQVDHIQF